jgi:hypothetical protein
MQGRTWDSLIEKMIEESGGSAPNGIEHTEEPLDEAKAEFVDGWLRELVMERLRASSPGSDPT